MYERLSRKRSYSFRSFTMQGVADVLTCLSDNVVEQGVFFNRLLYKTIVHIMLLCIEAVDFARA